MSRRSTGLIKSLFNWATGTGRTVHHKTTFLGSPKVEVIDYDKGYRSVRIGKQGLFGNKHSYKRESLDGQWQGEYKGERGFWTGRYFGNYEGQLPEAEDREYHECDINSTGGYRGAERIVFSNDGLIYYTGDHYKTFELLYGEP